VKIMSNDMKSTNRYIETPRDKPVSERTEHANLERPGAQAHPRARGWSHLGNPVMAWRVR
jgi:hypothetical protein